MEPLSAEKMMFVDCFQRLNFFPEILELYFDKCWALPDKIVMIADEQAAIVTFSDPTGLSFLYSWSLVQLMEV